MNCGLCGDRIIFIDNICKSCQDNVDAGKYPVICLGCRRTEGQYHSLTWLDEKDVPPEVREIFDKMKAEKKIIGMVRTGCSKDKRL